MRQKSIFLTLTIVFAVLLTAALTRLNESHASGEKRHYSQTPHNAYDFYNSLGICAHVTNYPTNYGEKQQVLRQLQYLDILDVRDDVRGSFEKMLETYEFFGRHGVRFNLIIHPKRVPDPAKYVANLIQLSPYLTAIEGGNEIDNLHRQIPFEPDARVMYEKAFEQQREIYETVKSLPETKHLPVYNFTTVMHEHNQALRDLLSKKLKAYGKPIADFDTIHAYDQSGLGPHKDTNKQIERYSLLSELPKVITETGYTTIQYSPQNAKMGGWRGISEEVSAKLLLNTIFSTYNWGIKKLYIFQLNDAVPDPQHLDKEAHFGLFNYDNEPKLSAIAIHNIRKILKEETPPDADVLYKNEPFAWWVEQTNSHGDYDFDQYHLLLQKRDGTRFLIVWAEPKIWDPKKHSPTIDRPEGNGITISFDTPLKSLRLYNPLKSVEPYNIHENADRIEFTVTDHPVILEINTGT